MGITVTLPEDAAEFAGLVLAHCASIASSLEPGQLICPFAVVQTDDGRTAVDFPSDTQQEALTKGWAHLDSSKEFASYWALGREEYINENGTKVDALAVSVWKPGMPHPVHFLQRFLPVASGAFRLFGALEMAIDRPGQSGHVLLQGAWRGIFESHLRSGIASHPKGGHWIEWSKHDA
jgi:hypothetical protein